MTNGPSAKEIRANLDTIRHRKSYWKALALFLVAFTAYLTSLLGAMSAQWYLQPLLILINGISIGVLFIIGHDACHRTYSPSRVLDGFIGRACFLPSLWTFSTWRTIHNYYHHGYTCLREKDYSWEPVALREYQDLSAFKKFLTRHMKTWLGMATHWIYEIWWVHGVVPQESDWKVLAKRKKEFAWEISLVAVYLLAKVSLIGYMTWDVMFIRGFGGVLMALAVYAFIPFWIYAFLTGLVTMVQHTHPRSVWFSDRREWDFFASQISDTVHFKFPFPVNKIFLDVMEHNAHHVDTAIPIYNLLGQQRKLEEAYPDHIIVETFSIRTINRILRTCQLYDYENHCWASFQGERTTEPIDLNKLVPGS